MTQKNPPRKPAAKKPARDKRDPQALELWRGGASFDLIAGKLGFRDAVAAEAAAVRELERSPNPDPADLVRLELHRLDVMQMALWPKARRGEESAIAMVLDIQKQRRRLRALESTKDLSLLDSVELTVRASEDLDPEKDAALIVASKKLAEQIDASTKAGSDPAMAIKSLYLIPHFSNLLKEMGATPEARKAMSGPAKGVSHGDRLQSFQNDIKVIRGGASKEEKTG